MVKRCCIASCGNCNKKEPGLHKSFHMFPTTNDLLRKLWLQFCRDDPHARKKEISCDSSFICSDHFSPDCYKTYTAKKMLEKDSIPSVYMIHGKPFFWLGHTAAKAAYKEAQLELDLPCTNITTPTQADMDHISSVDGVVIINQKRVSTSASCSEVASSESQIAERVKLNMRKEHSYFNSETSVSQGTTDRVKKKKMRKEHSNSDSAVAGTHGTTECVKKKMRQDHSYSNSDVTIIETDPIVPQVTTECSKKKVMSKEHPYSSSDVAEIVSPDISGDVTETVKKKMIQEHSYSISNRGETQRIANKKLKQVTKPKKHMKLLKVSVENVKPKENAAAPRKQVLKLRHVFNMLKQNHKVEVLEKQVQLLQTSVEKLTRNVQNINEVLKEIKKSETLSENGQKLIEKIISESPSEQKSADVA